MVRCTRRAECMLANMQDAKVATKLRSLQPDLVYITAPCTDFSGEGARQEGAAADCTKHAAGLIVAAALKLVVLENVVEMLSSEAWRRAQQAAHTLWLCGICSQTKGHRLGVGMQAAAMLRGHDKEHSTCTRALARLAQ